MDSKLVKQKRLSEDSTASESSASCSVESESDRQTDGSSSNGTGKEEEEPDSKSLLDDNDKMMEYLLSFPEIAGRYTDADPDFANDVEITTPPIVEGYNPRQYNKGGNQQHYQNRDRRGYQNHQQNRQNFQRNYRIDHHGNMRSDDERDSAQYRDQERRPKRRYDEPNYGGKTAKFEQHTRGGQDQEFE